MTGAIGKLWKAVALALGTGFGLGLAPIASGTFGSLLGPPLVWGVKSLGLPGWGYWMVAGLLMLAGGPICGEVGKHYQKKDPGQAVYDEIVAFFFVLMWVPLNLLTAVIGFFVFRVFDILKPPPARQLEYLPGGWGILMDDLAAGLYAGLVVLGLWEFLRYFANS